MNDMVKYLTSVASCIDNYCKFLNKELNDYSRILGYVYRVHQDKIKKITPQGVALIIIYLKDVDENDYGKYIDAFQKKVDRIIKRTNTVQEQLDKMDELKAKVE